MARQNQPWVLLTFPVWNPRLEFKVLRGQKAVLQEELKIARSLFNIVTATFSQENKPVWKQRVRASLRAEITGELTTVTPPLAYLMHGTKRRFAVLSRDYRRKTTPRKIASSGGRGRVLARGSAVSRAYARRKRIPAGNWDKVIAKQRSKPWAKAMQRRLALDTGIPHTKIRTTRIL